MAYLSTKKTLRLIKSYLPAIIRSKFKGNPFWVHFYLTRKCNLQCKYCFVRDNTKKDLQINEVKQVIDRLYGLGIRIIAFFGGEPTLRKDFCEILKYSYNKGIFTYFTTNGTLLNQKYIDEIGKSGADFIELSLDSILEFDVSKKDYVRSGGVLELLIRAKKKYGFGFKTHLVLTKKNIDNVLEVILLVQKYEVPMTVGYINRNTYNDIPEDESLYFNDSESKEKLFKVIDEIIKFKKKGVKIIDPIAYFEGMKSYVNGKTDWDCKAGKFFFSVDLDGSVQLCAGLKSFGTNILNIDRNFFRNKKQEINRTLSWCKKKCYSNCSFTTSYLINHPFTVIMGK